MTISQDKQKLIDKITKLMALAEGTSHTAEAESARNMAIDLMAKHNIDIQDINAKDQEEFIIEFEDSNRRRVPTEDCTLLAAVAHFCGVAFIINKNCPTVRYRLIGTPSAIEFYKYTRDIILNQRDWAWKQSGKRGSNVMYHWKMGYALGASHKLYELIKASENKVQQWGLVPVSEAKQALNWYKEGAKVTNRRASSIGGYDRQAYVAGTQVGINKGVTQSTLRIGR